MGKKRIAKKGGGADDALRTRALDKLPRKKIESGILYINSTYNNTLLTLTDEKGNTIIWSSAGSIGFKGTRKGTPFAASKAASLLAEKSKLIGLKNVQIVIKGIGAGRESAVRSFLNESGADLKTIKDATPIPHGGVKPPKPRRV